VKKDSTCMRAGSTRAGSVSRKPKIMILNPSINIQKLL
jgi:hypothetical protein